MAVFEVGQPLFDQAEHGGEVQAFVAGWVLGEVGAGEFEESGAGAEAIFLEVDKGAGELNEAFVKQVVMLAALAEPEFLKDVVRFVEELAIEALEIAEVMRVEISPVQRLDHLGDARALFAHAAL